MSYNPLAPPSKRTDKEEELRFAHRRAHRGGVVSDHGTDVPPIDTAKFRSHCQDWLGFNEYAVDECFALCDEVDRLRGLLARALPWIDPNDSHEDYLLTVEIRKALGEGT